MLKILIFVIIILIMAVVYIYGLLLDKRDRRYQTTDGYLSKFNQRVPILSEDYGLYNSYYCFIFFGLFFWY